MRRETPNVSPQRICYNFQLFNLAVAVPQSKTGKNLGILFLSVNLMVTYQPESYLTDGACVQDIATLKIQEYCFDEGVLKGFKLSSKRSGELFPGLYYAKWFEIHKKSFESW